MMMDQIIKMPLCGVPSEGANLEYLICLFSYHYEKSVLKLKCWIKVSGTGFQARRQTQPG